MTGKIFNSIVIKLKSFHNKNHRITIWNIFSHVFLEFFNMVHNRKVNKGTQLCEHFFFSYRDSLNM